MAKKQSRSYAAGRIEGSDSVSDKDLKGLWIAYRLRETTRLFGKVLERRLNEIGISLAQARHLNELWLKDGLTQREISDSLGHRGPTTVMAIRSLEVRGLITRRRSKTDKRKSHIYLSKAGRELEAKVLKVSNKVERAALQDLTDGDVKKLWDMINRIQSSLSSIPD